MHTEMDWWTKIRLEVSREESSKREILRRERIGWDTLKKILRHPEPPGYRLKEPRPKPRIGPYFERIAQIIEEDKAGSEETTPNGQADLRAHPGDGLRGGIYPGEGGRAGVFAGEARGVHAVDPSVGRGAGGFWVCVGEGFQRSQEYYRNIGGFLLFLQRCAKFISVHFGH